MPSAGLLQRKGSGSALVAAMCASVLASGSAAERWTPRRLLGRPVPAAAAADDGPRLDGEGGEQRGRAVAGVVVRAPLGSAGAQRQERPRPVERLDPGPPVRPQRQGSVGRAATEPAGVAHPPDGRGVGGELGGLAPVRPPAEGAPDAADRGGADAGLAGHRRVGQAGGAAQDAARPQGLARPPAGMP